MAKDPATLFYWNDWHSGTVTLSRFLKGCYMDLLHAQFNNGHLSLDEIRTVLGSDFGSSWPTLQKKFKTDDKGLYFNERLLSEAVKRKSYTASRRSNSEGHMPKHMENEIENRKLKFESEAAGYAGEFSDRTIVDFCSYWLEMNKSGTKFRFEGQKFFDMKKRLQTWKRNERPQPADKHAAAMSNKLDANKQVEQMINQKYAASENPK